MTDKKTEALKLALEKFANVKALCDKHGDKINRKHVYGGALIEHFDVVCQALAEQPAQKEPVAWRDHVEQRLLTWRQSFVNKSGDQLALDDFMDKRSLDDLIDFVCSEYTSPPASKPWVGLTDEEKLHLIKHNPYKSAIDLLNAHEAKLKEKNE